MPDLIVEKGPDPIFTSESANFTVADPDPPPENFF